MVFLRSALFNLLFFSLTAFVLVAYLPLFLGPPSWVRAATRFWAVGVLWLLAIIVGLRYRIRGAEHLPRGTGIIASNHQSAWDAIVFLALLPDAVYVLKQELLRVPLLGWYLRRLKMIPIDRAAGGRALQRMLHDPEQTAATRQIIVFPEGTRVPPGEQRPYRSGVSALYSRLALPLTPVALNSGLFWPRRGFIKRPGTITLIVLPAIEPGLERHHFMAVLEGRIRAAQAEL
ncbi:MAG: 1-acyl-sn-glycerol-3-phosphate acyltransferase [Rhodospirillaceae bacterium]|nr:1-acyl-sn-glycerol-3-phosphate acyltransferase [Rhodospirillaceae bacterium]